MKQDSLDARLEAWRIELERRKLVDDLAKHNDGVAAASAALDSVRLDLGERRAAYKASDDALAKRRLLLEQATETLNLDHER